LLFIINQSKYLSWIMLWCIHSHQFVYIYPLLVFCSSHVQFSFYIAVEKTHLIVDHLLYQQSRRAQNQPYA
jgi:hypothetical protein